MRILYCTSSLARAGGIERVLTRKANWLSADGAEVHIVTARQKGRKPFFPLDPGVHLVDLHRSFTGTFRERLRKAVSSIDPDICISLGGKDAYFLPEAAQGRPCLVEYHFCYDKFFLKYPKPYAWLRTRLRDRAFGKFDCLVALTRADRPAWSPVIRDVRQIYNPVTTAAPQESPASPLDARRMIAVGRLETEKNFADLIRAWRRVASAHPDWKLDIFGEGSQRNKLQGLIRGLGLEGKVTLCGASDAIAAEYLRSSALVLCSRREGFPLVLVEGCSAGLPLISYDCPTGPSEIIEDGVNGLLVKTGDTDQLAASVCRIIEDEALRKNMGAAALRTARRFTPPVVMGQWKALFAELTAGKHR